MTPTRNHSLNKLTFYCFDGLNYYSETEVRNKFKISKSQLRYLVEKGKAQVFRQEEPKPIVRKNYTPYKFS